ncbi:MAG: TRAP-type C4-dicarboxylate transport system small permease [bacterium]|nr:MAG: TRAP-type C4-dicarboxylate transport system small permease [bacterium]
MIFVCFEVFTRYILGFSTAWIEGSARYLIICFVLLLAAPLTKRDEHIAFTLLDTRLTGWGKRITRLIIIIAGVCVPIYTAVYTLQITLMLKRWGTTSESAEFLRMWWIYAFMIAGMVLIAFYYLEQLASWVVSLAKDRGEEV